MSKSMMARHAVQGSEALAKYVAEKNRWRRIRGDPEMHVGNLTPKDIKYLRDCWEGDSSPENVAMDGEAPASYVRARYAELNRIKLALDALEASNRYK